MKHAIIIVLFGLLVLGASSAFGRDNPVGQNVMLSPETISLEGDIEPAIRGPLRDEEGDDWLIYDDENWRNSYYPAPWVYARTVFLPNADFRLQQIWICPWNGRNSQAPINVYVYAQNAQNTLTQRLFQGRFNQLGEWGGNVAASWNVLDLEEGGYLELAGQERFSIIYGPCPGGDAGNQNNQGPWVILDGAASGPNFITLVANANTPPPTNHALWSNNQNGAATAGDLFIRANGTYTNDFIDVGILSVFNGDVADGVPGDPLSGQYLMTPGTEQVFKAQLANMSSSQTDLVVVTFSVLNEGNEEIFTSEVLVEDFAVEDTIVVTCEEAWSAQAVGTYRVFVTATAGDDSNPDNDQGGLEQIVFDPVDEADQWIKFDDGEFETSTGSDPGGLGWGCMFIHPGGVQLLAMTDYQVKLEPTAEGELEAEFLVSIWNIEERSIEDVLRDTVATNGNPEAQWVGRSLGDDEVITFGAGQAIIVIYISSPGLRISMDTSPPVSGDNNRMPFSMTAWDTQNGHYGAGSGDYGVEIKVAESDELPEGALLSIDPDTLDFGTVEAGVDHTIEAIFTATGQDTVVVTAINIPGTLRNFVTVSHTERFEIASLETTIVTVTFRADEDTTLAASLLVSSNWEGNPRHSWPLRATAALGVNEHVRPGLPGSYTLEQNFPNPFNPTTTIGFALVKSGEVTFGVYDMNGRLVSDLYTGRLEAGYHSFDFDASNLPAGIYTYRLNAGDYSNAKKMVLMK